MLTAHQRILISRHLPEVIEVGTSNGDGPWSIYAIAMVLCDSTQIIVAGSSELDSGQPRASRFHYTPDSRGAGGRVPIDADLRRRLQLVFGELDFQDFQGDDE